MELAKRVDCERGKRDPTPLPPPVGNVTYDTGTATLYGVHEVSFTLAPVSNPYALQKLITFTAQDGSGATVKAFYDGPSGSQDRWVARVYVNRVGAWTWSLAPGATCPASPCTFIAIDQSEAGLHGMLRVAPDSSTSAKRWYTDDGQTFLPKADTAYRLFLEVPPEQISPNWPECPANLPMASSQVADQFVADYVDSVAAHGINVLRAESLGTWAYTDVEIGARVCDEDDPKCPAKPNARNGDCNADWNLFLSGNKNGQEDNLFDGPPDYAQMQSLTLYPNLKSFRRTDRKLKLLLNQYPSIYVQIMIAPAPMYNREFGWYPSAIDATERGWLWQNMVARWAAFPNVFWSVSGDLNDTKSVNIAVAREIGCYWMGGSGSECQGLSSANDPWRDGRPMSMGHLRNAIDGSISKPWHSYITAYTKADISAQQLDGVTDFGDAPPFDYIDNPKPVYNTEDLYEGPDDPSSATPHKSVKNPDYFFRRLFWSHLLSGSGATYGSYPTWRMMHEYEAGAYLAYPDPTSTPSATPTPIVFTLEGLDSITFTNAILHQAQVDLASFTPADQLILQGTPASGWKEYERAQVVSNTQEILAYIPHTSAPAYPVFSERQRAMEDITNRTVTVNMTEYRDPTYRVTWYEPASGMIIGTETIPGNVDGQISYLKNDSTNWQCWRRGVAHQLTLRVAQRLPADGHQPANEYTHSDWHSSRASAGFSRGRRPQCGGSARQLS